MANWSFEIGLLSIRAFEENSIRSFERVIFFKSLNLMNNPKKHWLINILNFVQPKSMSAFEIKIVEVLESVLT